MYDPPLILSVPTCAVQVAAGAMPALLVGGALAGFAAVGVAEGFPRRLSAKKEVKVFVEIRGSWTGAY